MAAIADPCAGVGRLLAAAKDDRVAGGEGHGRRIGRDVRPRFVDEKHDAQRHANLADDQARGPGRFLEHFPDGIGQRRHRLDTGGDALDPLGIEREPVDRGGREPKARGSCDVELVGGEDLLHIGPDLGGGRLQAGGFFLRGHGSQIDRGVAGPGGDIATLLGKL